MSSYNNPDSLKIDSPRTISKRKIVKIKRMNAKSGEITSEVPAQAIYEEHFTKHLIEETKESKPISATKFQSQQQNVT